MMPAGAEQRAGEWHFNLPDDGVEPLLASLVAGHHGVEGLSIERPGLHEAVVRIVGQRRDERPGEAQV